MAQSTNNTATQRKAKRDAAATRRSTQAKKAAGTRARRSASTPKTVKSAQRGARKTERKVQQVERTAPVVVRDTAEKAVLIQVGAALTALDRVGDLVDTYSSRDTAERELRRELRRFERRGATARTRVERQVRKTRTRVERDLRQRRNRAERVVKRTRRDAERSAKDAAARVDQATAGVGNVVQSGVTAAEKAGARTQNRVADVA